MKAVFFVMLLSMGLVQAVERHMYVEEIDESDNHASLDDERNTTTNGCFGFLSYFQRCCCSCFKRPASDPRPSFIPRPRPVTPREIPEM